MSEREARGEAVAGLAVTLLLFVAIVGCCSLTGGGRASTDAMRACAESCGERGMASWSYTDGCACAPEVSR